MAVHQRQTWVEGEPSLAELLSDPMIDHLLRRDGVTRQDMWRAVEAAQRGLIGRARVPAERRAKAPAERRRGTAA